MTPPSLPPNTFGAQPPIVQAYIRHLESCLAALKAPIAGRMAEWRAL
jgi:hypothetical protein